MAGSRIPGTIGFDGPVENLADGTLVRQASPLPGNLNAGFDLKLVPIPRAPGKLSNLHRGSRGRRVRQLQRLLKVRIIPDVQLKVDGIYGPRTHLVVRVYQRRVEIKVDGIVGPITWAHLLTGQTANLFNSLVKGLELPALVAIPKPEKIRVTVYDLPLEEKFKRVIARVPNRLPDAIANQLRAMVEPENLAIMLTLIALFSLLSGGTALVLGAIALGFDAAMALAAAIQITILAANENELDQAADSLAALVIIVGVGAFLKAVTRGAGKLRTSGRGSKLPAPMAPRAPGGTGSTRGKTSVAGQGQHWSPPRPPKAPPAPGGTGSTRGKTSVAGQGQHWSPPPSNPILLRLRQLTRQKLLQEIRRVTGNDDAVLWEQIGHGDIYKEIFADARMAKALGVRIGDVIAYTFEKPPTGSATGGLMLTPQDVSPHGDPFR